jgi:hypothetical protein
MQNFGDSSTSCCIRLKTSNKGDAVLLGYDTESIGIRIPTLPGNGILLPTDAVSYRRSAESLATTALTQR